MTRRFCLITLFLLGCAASWAQVQDDSFFGPHIDKLMGEGKYEEAYDLIKKGIEKNETTQNYSATYYACLAKFYIEMGRPRDAAEALRVADVVASRMGVGNAFLERETATLHLIQGEYNAAASSATKALREFSYRKADRIVWAYCRSLEAIARLRAGDLKRAESLIRQALQDIPKDDNAPQLFGSRILFAACIVESHRGNFAEAQEFCSRGQQILERKKIENRDISLGFLALAESCMLSGDLARGRELAEKAMEITAKMFRPDHQDRINALMILARIELKDKKPAEALVHAQAAVDMAVTIFGEGAGGVKAPHQLLQEAAKANAK